MSNMEDNRSSVKVGGYDGRMKSVYSRRVEVEGPADQFTVLIGFGMIVLRHYCVHETSALVSRVRAILARIQNQDNCSFIENFVQWIENGSQVQGLDGIANAEYVIKVIWYCVSHVKTFLLASLRVDNKENAFNEKYDRKVECVCRELGIRIFVETESKKYFFGKRDCGPVIHLVKEGGKYYLLSGAVGSIEVVWKAYGEVLGLVESFVEILEKTQKFLSLRKRRALLQVFEVVECLMDGKYEDFLEYCRALRDVGCQHKKVYLYETICGRYHCVLCVFEKSKLKSMLEKECLCSKRISPKDFCKISKVILKLRKKEQLKKQIELNYNNFHKLANEIKSKLGNDLDRPSNREELYSDRNVNSLNGSSVRLENSSMPMYQEYLPTAQPAPIVQTSTGSSLMCQPGNSPTQPNPNLSSHSSNPISSNYAAYQSSNPNLNTPSQNYPSYSNFPSSYSHSSASGINLQSTHISSGLNSSSFAATSGISQNIALSNSGEVVQSDQPKADSSSVLCSMCSVVQVHASIEIKCRTHQLCISCIKQDLSKCTFCKRQYKPKEKQHLHSLLNQ